MCLELFILPLEEEKKGEERRYLLPSARMNEGRFSSARGDQDSFIAFSYRATGSFRAKIRIETGSKRDYAKRNLRISPIRVDTVVTILEILLYIKIYLLNVSLVLELKKRILNVR